MHKNRLKYSNITSLAVLENEQNLGLQGSLFKVITKVWLIYYTGK